MRYIPAVSSTRGKSICGASCAWTFAKLVSSARSARCREHRENRESAGIDTPKKRLARSQAGMKRPACSGPFSRIGPAPGEQGSDRLGGSLVCLLLGNFLVARLGYLVLGCGLHGLGSRSGFRRNHCGCRGRRRCRGRRCGSLGMGSKSEKAGRKGGNNFVHKNFQNRKTPFLDA